MEIRSRIDAEIAVSEYALCDVYLVDGKRTGDELPGFAAGRILGMWPVELETDTLVRLAQKVGEEPTWDDLASTPPVAQKLGERARPQPLDIQIIKHRQHLQEVCHRPRLHLRVEEERLPVSRARRTPVRAVADLVSHPGDWEHRTLQSIQPSRVLARQVEDEWNLYENRVAVRLVDNLLAYLAKRLEELKRIKKVCDYTSEMNRTTFWRAKRVSTLWSHTLESRTEKELETTMRKLELAQHDLQALLDSPLYRRVPRRLSVPLALKPTNILINDTHYRKIATLWREWVKHGHKRPETIQQRAERRHREAVAWDCFILHLAVRALVSLGWTAAETEKGWEITREGWLPAALSMEESGIVNLAVRNSVLRLLPLCASLVGTDGHALMTQLESWDSLQGEFVAAYVGEPVDLKDIDRAAGWSFNSQAVLFGCSPWGIDSEERMARLINGWLNRVALHEYPPVISVRDLPALPRGCDWLHCEGSNLVALRAPSSQEFDDVQNWAANQVLELEAKAQQAKLSRQAFPVGPREAIKAFRAFINAVTSALAALEYCPVCGNKGIVEGRFGRKSDGSDATWWGVCSCASEWGLRRCTGCGTRHRVLIPQSGLDLARVAATTPPLDWPDKVLGRDVWAQPCSSASGRFRCPECGACGAVSCEKCDERGEKVPASAV